MWYLQLTPESQFTFELPQKTHGFRPYHHQRGPKESGQPIVLCLIKRFRDDNSQHRSALGSMDEDTERVSADMWGLNGIGIQSELLTCLDWTRYRVRMLLIPYR